MSKGQKINEGSIRKGGIGSKPTTPPPPPPKGQGGSKPSMSNEGSKNRR